MFWSDIFPSLREEKRRSNLIHPKERHIWVQVSILHKTEEAILIDNGTKARVVFLSSETRNHRLFHHLSSLNRPSSS